MDTQALLSLEKVGVGLVSSLETFRGCTIQLVNKRSGFNGLSTNKNGNVRKIEVKSMLKCFNWIAINSLTAIDKLFFERDYWIYFVLLPDNYVVTTRGLPFIRRQLSLAEKVEFIDEMRDWMRATKKLTKKSALKFVPRLHLKLPVPLDKLVQELVNQPNNNEWHDSVDEIWQNRKTWTRIYAAPESDEM
jgi:hypothetical protein